MQTWRRDHGVGCRTHVFHDGTGYVAVVEVAQHLQRLPRTFPRLQSAQAAADHRLRRTFDHLCSMERCGEWLLWTE